MVGNGGDERRRRVRRFRRDDHRFVLVRRTARERVIDEQAGVTRRADRFAMLERFIDEVIRVRIP